MRKREFLRKYGALVIIAVILVAGIAVALAVGADETKKTDKTATTGQCGNYRNDIQVRINGHTFNTEVAKSPAEFDKGLGGRPCIKDDQAMLFSFTKPGQYPFWMKGMKFPIDIIWIGADSKVAAIEIDEKPSTYPDKFVNQKPAQYVLEVKANLTKQLYIGLGTPVTL